MRDLFAYIIVGLTSGSVYALAALGLVVTYKTSGIFNFAQGAAGMLATYVFYELRESAGLATTLALIVAVLLFSPAMGAAIDRIALRGLSGAAPATYVVASLGLLVALQGLGPILFGAEAKTVEPFLPQSTFEVAGVRVGWDQVIIVLIALGSALLLSALFARTAFGLRTRAVVDDDSLTELMGTNARLVTTGSWMIGTGFAALSGILIAPSIGLDAAILTLLVVQAFGAAVIGRLTSLAWTYAGGLAIGVLASLSSRLVEDHPSLAGLPASVPFLVLFLVLVFARKGWFTELTRVRALAPRTRTAVRPPRPIALVGGTAVAVLVPFVLPGNRILTATATLVFVLIFASLGLLVGLSRQVSLCHAVFVALGATTLSQLLDAGLPFVVALPLAGLAVVPVGAIVSIPAIRLSGLFLALATFGFGVLAQELLFPTSWVFGQRSVVNIDRPELFGIDFTGDRSFYLFVLAVVVAGVLVVEIVARTRLGRLLRAIADSPTAVEAIGVRLTGARVLVFCLSAFLAAVAGGLLGSLYRSVNTVSFDFFQSLLWLTVLVTAGAASLGGAILAAVFLITVPAVFTDSAVREWQPVFFGLAAILLAQRSNGLIGLLKLDYPRLAAASRWRLASSPWVRREPRPVREPVAAGGG